MEKGLYGWQEECLGRWFANHGRGIVQAVTGAGKTQLALEAASRMDRKLGGGLLVRIVVPNGALMRQWDQALREHLAALQGSADKRDTIRGMIGRRGGGSWSDSEHKYMLYVINSARYELARQTLTELKQGRDVLLIADECHRYESGQNGLIFEFIPYIQPYENHYFSLGLSATLSAMSQARLSSALGRKIYHYGTKEASLERVICPVDIWHIGMNFQDEERQEYERLSEQMTFLWQKLQARYPMLNKMTVKERYDLLRSLAGDKNRETAEAAASYMKLTFARKRLVCLASARTACVRDLAGLLGIRDKMIIFGERIDQADELYEALQEAFPEKVGRYHSRMGSQANKNALERFREGSIRILIACKAIDEGIDVPDAGIGIILSGTSAQRQRVQRLGRIIRKNEAKDRAALYYLHVEDTSEDTCYLPEENVHRLFELTYDARTHRFGNPAYDERACELLAEMENADTDGEKLQEARRCLRLGSIRADWMLTAGELKKKIEGAGDIRERNYWVCMKRLRREV